MTVSKRKSFGFWAALPASLLAGGAAVGQPPSPGGNCPLPPLDGLRVGGTLRLIGPDGAFQREFRFENTYLPDGIAARFEGQKSREAFLLNYESSRDGTGRYALAGGEPGYEDFANLGSFSSGPNEPAAMAIPLQILWDASHPGLSGAEVREASLPAGCELIVTRDTGCDNCEVVWTHRFVSGRWTWSELTMVRDGSGPPMISSRIEGTGTADGEEWLPAKLVMKSWSSWSARTGEPAGQARTWEVTFSDVSRVDPAAKAGQVFDEISTGMVELQPGEYFDVKSQSARKAASGGQLLPRGEVALAPGVKVDSGFRIPGSIAGWLLAGAGLLALGVLVRDQIRAARSSR